MSIKFFAGLLLVMLFACGNSPTPRFELRDPRQTGVDFVNAIVEDDSVNILQYEYLYNGGGVGVGDFDRDGRYDLFFSGNLVSSELYLQKELGVFTKVTELAGLSTDQWCAGVTVGDFDANGFEDIYLSVLDPADERPSPNLLFLNDGPGGPDSLPHFREVASAVGVADNGYGTHAAMVDLNRDGLLDLYVLNNSLESYPRNLARGTDTTGRGKSVDRIYLKVSEPGADPVFQLQTKFKTEGWGLGVAVQDFDGNGYSDVYVGNDFGASDFLLFNDGTQIEERISQVMPHQSKNTMGVDVGDLDNDGLPDIVTVDMLPDDNLRRKTMFADIPFSNFAQMERSGYNTQYVRNTLQRGNADGSFSDVAFLAGVAATDWSWAPLIADFDNDGLRDLFISNGYPRDITNRDFMDYTEKLSQFGTQEARYEAVAKALTTLGGVYQEDLIFQNEGNMVLSKTDWLPEAPTYSNGAVWVDLDNDGDLDLVTNNINQPAGIYYNQSREMNPERTHYLSVRLDGPEGNGDALGARVYLSAGDLTLYSEQQRQRGYLSTVDARLHFGLGERTTVDSILVVWPDGRESVRKNLAVDQLLEIDYASSTDPQGSSATYFQKERASLDSIKLSWLPTHRESRYSDFDRYALALRDFSHGGPVLTVTEDQHVIFGGAAGQEVSIWDIETGNLVQRLTETTNSEATSLLLFDFDGDGDKDLYVGNGSSEFAFEKEKMRDLLYVNNAGIFEISDSVIPNLDVFTGAVAAADLEGDGDLDLFIGVRMKIDSYPHTPTSYILENQNGQFRIHTELNTGMVTGAVWKDFDGDSQHDLAVTGDFNSLRIFLNKGGTFEPQPIDPNLVGWWYCLIENDLDGDGDIDLLGGNYGTNSMYRASKDHPLIMRAEDYDGNGAIDPIVSAYDGTDEYPVHPRNTLGRQIPTLKRQIPDYATYGGWTVANMPVMSEEGIQLEAREFRSAWFENDGTGRFTPRFLPWQGQTAPIRSAVPWNLNDGSTAMLVVQNDYATEILGGKMDAGTGFALILDAEGNPKILNDYWSVRGDARSVARSDELIFVGFNGKRIKAFQRAELTTEQLQ